VEVEPTEVVVGTDVELLVMVVDIAELELADTLM
jgi:hypothetical protein